MKNKQFIIFIFTCVIFVNKGITQSKEETIDWISEKIKLYGNTRNQLINSVSGGIVTWTLTDDYGYHLKRVSQWDLNTISGFVEWYYSAYQLDCIGIILSPDKIIHTHDSSENSLFIILDWNREKDLKERFKKALAKLIEYNLRTLKKEVF